MIEPVVVWMDTGSSALAAFLASLVEFAEALTVILAVGSVRGWRGALAGAAVAVLVLGLVVLALGSTLLLVPLRSVRLVVGILLLLVGLRWLKKAVLRFAGALAMRDEAAAFARQTETMRGLGEGRAWDPAGFAATFQVTMLEGTEVVFIVIAAGAGGSGLLDSASLGALAALLCVVLLGVVLHRPLARLPENSLKFVVGVLLSAFGCFWVGEGCGIDWIGADWSIPGLIAGFGLTAWLAIPLCRSRRLVRVR